MNILKLERLYKELGLYSYRLKTKADLFYIHGVKLDQVEGYRKLNAGEKKIFNKFIINFFNSHTLDDRDITPVKVYLAIENVYVIDTEEISNLPVKKEIVNAKTKKIESTWEYEKFKDRNSRLHKVESYLRFEYLKEGVEGSVHVNKSGWCY